MLGQVSLIRVFTALVSVFAFLYITYSFTVGYQMGIDNDYFVICRGVKIGNYCFGIVGKRPIRGFYPENINKSSQ